jgi:lipopolysaccharide transport system ATP-binding protein
MMLLDLFRTSPRAATATISDPRQQDLGVPDLAVRATNLGKRYGDFWAVKGVNLSVAKGVSVGIIGLNGAGKSTLLQMIAGTLTPSEGTSAVSGRVLALLDLGAGFSDDFTGLENLYLSASILGLPRSLIDGHLGEIEEFAEIGAFLREPMRTYSSGMRVRLAFALLTQVRPDVMIIDEVLSVGDAYFAHKCARLLRQFREEGRSLLFVSHDPNAVKTYCDHAILLDHGMVVREGGPADVLDYYNALIAAKERELEIRVSEAVGGRRQTRSGDGRATLDRFDLLDTDGRSIRAALCGATVRIVCAVEFKQAVAAPTVGFLIRDRLGNDVFGTNTCNLGLATRTYAAGEFMEVAFSLPLNLGPGNYSLTLAIHAGADHREGNYDWCDNLLAFTIVPHWPFAFAGVAALATTAEVSDQVRLLTRDCPWNQPIDFSDTGNAHRFQVGGWCIPERGHCWTLGQEAMLAVRLPPGGARVIADVFPFIPSGGTAQQVQFGCGESVLANWEIARPMSVAADIPPALRSGTGELRLWWRLPGAASPASSGISNDTRILALAFQRITFHPLDGSC